MDATNRKGLPGSSTSANGSDIQGLLKVANQMLLATGRNAADIKAGKTFDAGSALTEPKDAWNLNRISTILQQNGQTTRTTVK